MEWANHAPESAETQAAEPLAIETRSVELQSKRPSYNDNEPKSLIAVALENWASTKHQHKVRFLISEDDDFVVVELPGDFLYDALPFVARRFRYVKQRQPPESSESNSTSNNIDQDVSIVRDTDTNTIRICRYRNPKTINQNMRFQWLGHVIGMNFSRGPFLLFLFFSFVF